VHRNVYLKHSKISTVQHCDSDSEQEEDGIYCVYVLYSLSWVQ